jgi:hypothetical protein
MRQLTREDRKRILQVRPPAEFMALLEQIYIPA